MFKNRFAAVTTAFLVAILRTPYVRSEDATRLSRGRLSHTATPYAGGEDTPAHAVPVELFPLPANTVFERHVVGETGTATPRAERLIYSNTLGTFAAKLGAGRLVSDDVATTAPDGCKLRRYEFPVVGKVDPNGIGGPFTVDIALYSSCPFSVPAAQRPSLLLPGTSWQVTFPDDAPRIISFVAAVDMPLPTNFWFGVKFSRNNAGVILGAPATVGFSADNLDFPGFSCDTNLGGFPDHPHASFNLEIFGEADCPEAFVGYKNNKPSGSVYNPGAGVFLADDIQLGVNECQMIAYEVAVRGGGFYTIRMQQSCESGLIAGTERTWPQPPTSEVKIVRFAFDPPIALPQNLWFEASVLNITGSVVISGQQASIGRTDDLLRTVEYNTCNDVLPSDLGVGIHGAINLTITCAGPAPIGACCDMVFTDVNNEAVCRELPRMNCPWPSPNWYWPQPQPQWIEGTTCSPDPFPFPCGIAACCRPDQVCENLTQNECNAVTPLDGPRRWQRGQYCGVDGQGCPWMACLPRTGDCHSAHEGPGCQYPECCHYICEADSYCCLVEWDRVCVEAADILCNEREHDECFSTTARFASLTVEADSMTAFSNGGATESPSDPRFCCHPLGTDQIGYNTMWFKFTATDASARVSLCQSDPAGDSLFQVFSVGDPTTQESACATLTYIACGDDSDGCGDGRHAEICLDDLVPGQTYYVMVASKTPELQGVYQLEIRSPCFDGPAWSSADCNNNGFADGCDLGRKAAADCNASDVLDECEIAAGTSFDCDQNGFLDECGGVVDSLKPTILTQGAGFGSSVAMDGNWLAVGSGIYTTESIDRHTLHFFRKNAAGWDLRNTYELPVPPSYVAIKRETVLVTSDRDNTVYIFICYDEGCYPDGSFQGPAGAPCLRFGMPLAYDEYKAVVGIGFCQDVPGSKLAEVHVVDVWQHGWEENARIPSPMTGVDDSFGAAVAIDHKAILIGAPAYHTGGPGAAYLYYKTQFGWELETTFVPSDSRDHDLFGRAVALSGDVAIVGATLADGPTQAETGAVYVFRRVWADWVQQAKLTVAPVTGYDRFGASVSLAGNILVIGALYRNAATVYRQIAGRWIEESQLTVNPPGGTDFFGWSVFTDGALIAVGAPATYSEYPLPDGRAFVFQPIVRDCNKNQVPDECDLRDRTSRDINYDETPDECQQTPTPDWDSDLDVDLKDFAAFMNCYRGPQRPIFVQSECLMFDLPPDLDIDLFDFAGFQNAFRGPGRQPP